MRLSMLMLFLSVGVPGCGGSDTSLATAPAEQDKSTVPATVETPPPALLNAPVDSSSVTPDSVATERAREKKPRDPIYHPEEDAKAMIAAAVERAHLDNKRVLIEWGGNWCGWCYKLHDVFTSDELVQPLVSEEYELVLIDSDSNRDLMESYGGANRQYSFPHLTVLDSEGRTLTNQETGPLEIGPKHDPAKVAEFLKTWSVARVDAEDALARALTEAASGDKSVLMQVGTPYCGWCKVLSRFMARQQELLSRDYVYLKIDTMRMDSGRQVAEHFQPADSPGVPWMVILRSDGHVLATSISPEGNIGYPYQPTEIDHFMTMLTSTRKRLTDSDLATLRTDLEAERQAREKKRDQAAVK